MAGSLNPMMGFLALIQGDDDMAAQIFSQFGTPQGTQNEFLQLAQGYTITYPGAGSITPGMTAEWDIPWWQRQGYSSLEEATAAVRQSTDAALEKTNPRRGSGGRPLQDTAVGQFFAPAAPVSPGRGGTMQANEERAAEMAAQMVQENAATQFAPGPTTDPSVAEAQLATAAAQQAPQSGGPAQPQGAPGSLGALLGGAPMPGMTAEEQFLNTLGAIEAPDSQRPPPPGAVAPSRGTQVQPTLARLLTQMLSMGAANPPTFRSLMR